MSVTGNDIKPDCKPKNRSPLPTKQNLYNKDGKHNTTYTVCHNTRIDRTPYIRKSKEKQSTTVAV
ncbi:hypothetical protein QUB19_07590 [Microcoleus sp. B4-C5]|uniref:hypothetical protein n=1 Tax=unclassified Microcoleus TaxID=2642155 RepID=UPI002FD03301